MLQLSTYENTSKTWINNTNKGKKTDHGINKIKAKKLTNLLISIIV